MLLEDFAKELLETAERVESSDYREPLKIAGKTFGDEVGKNFLREESESGSAWPEHSPVTVAIYGPHPLLRLSYVMMTAATDYGNPGASMVLENNQITIGIDGNEIPYAATQNDGGGNIPAREFFYLNEDSQGLLGAELEINCISVIEEEVMP